MRCLRDQATGAIPGDTIFFSAFFYFCLIMGERHKRYNFNYVIGGLIVIEALSSDEARISWSKMAWTANDWIGLFRPHSVAPALHIAKFTVKGI